MDKFSASLLVFVGAGLGGVLRYWISEAVATPPNGFPFATLLINAVGCLTIGVLVGLQPAMTVGPRLLLLVGVLGGFTTFSAYAREVLDLWRAGQPWLACVYLLSSNILAISLAAAGYRTTRAVFSGE